MPVRLELPRTTGALGRSGHRGGPILVGRARLTIYAAPRAGMMRATGVVGAANRRAADTVIRYAKDSINRPRPRVRTGRMRDTLHANFRGSNQYQSKATIRSRAFYDIYQHDGTKNPDGSQRIHPRPFLTDALRRLRPRDWAA